MVDGARRQEKELCNCTRAERVTEAAASAFFLGRLNSFFSLFLGGLLTFFGGFAEFDEEKKMVSLFVLLCTKCKDHSNRRHSN